jgi:hypothetical protein
MENSNRNDIRDLILRAFYVIVTAALMAAFYRNPDMNRDGRVDALDVQIVVNTVLEDTDASGN